MTKHARYEREQRAAQSARIKEIEAAWMGSLTPATAQAFTAAVESARARGPVEPPPPMAPGTAPRPPRPGREPRPSKEERKRSRPFKD
ncbi:MAG: hypothetical protein OEV61_08325 [Chloroflexota bacterium]|jgi:hypothetical protein|nr:hypothetical protein [Chloroflexota bacterium]MDH5244708.1 hypothetical protein [Chloroflexota bacterium]